MFPTVLSPLPWDRLPRRRQTRPLRRPRTRSIWLTTEASPQIASTGSTSLLVLLPVPISQFVTTWLTIATAPVSTQVTCSWTCTEHSCSHPRPEASGLNGLSTLSTLLSSCSSPSICASWVLTSKLISLSMNKSIKKHRLKPRRKPKKRLLQRRRLLKQGSLRSWRKRQRLRKTKLPSTTKSSLTCSP